MKDNICIGVVGAGRATQLHMEAYETVSNVNIRYKTIVAKRIEQLEKAKDAYGFEYISTNINDILDDPEIDVVDICTPPYCHIEFIKKALKANKHVICEKPLTGYCGEDMVNGVAFEVSKKEMYNRICDELNSLKAEIEKSNKIFMYAENFVYAPAVCKINEIINAKKTKLLFLKGEESLKGSSSHVANEWSKTGGGSLIRVGSHPLSAILWLKQQESLYRNEDIKIKSIYCNDGQLTKGLTKYEHRHISAHPNDVEDFATLIITFSDNTRALIIATDVLLGGSKNYIDVYGNDVAMTCNLTPNNLLNTYLLDEDGMNDVYISEMLPSKLGWNQPFISDNIIRGYRDEIQDFVNCIVKNEKPKSGFDLAYDTIKVIYAAYYSAEIKKEIEFDN